VLELGEDMAFANIVVVAPNAVPAIADSIGIRGMARFGLDFVSVFSETIGKAVEEILKSVILSNLTLKCDSKNVFRSVEFILEKTS
jgi:hypothetical protein